MRKARITILTTHVDLHGDRFAPEGLESTAAGINCRYLPLTVEHDLRIPPIGRIVSAEVTSLPDGEHAIEADVEIFEENDTPEVLAGDGRTVRISLDDIPTFIAEFDRSYESESGQRTLAALRSLSPTSKTTPVVKKAVEPISMLIIAGGVFAFAAVATGFLNKLGSDLYDGLKKTLAGHFAGTSESKLLDFRFTTVHEEDFVEVHVLVENPTPEVLESLFTSNFGGLDIFLSGIDPAELAIVRLVLKYKDDRLILLYALRKDCVPLTQR
ncbi:MAG TPA: hypothetical protein VMF91_15850 [Bryobacteraceae bacterium]|nr:hypothetical protein [Bryobacteraceae bacterium]